jgi:hypothetical protein
MPTYPLMQPNGLYAIFSTIVDDFTGMNLLRSEVRAEFASRGGEASADRLLARADRDVECACYDDDAPEGRRRWEGSLDTVKVVHGAPLAEARRRQGEDKAPPADPSAG